MAANLMVKVSSVCMICRIKDEFDVLKTEMDARRRGLPIAMAYKTLSQERLIQLTQHVCPECQRMES